MKKKYLPINCDFYDELELLALRQKPFVLVYENESGERLERTTVIKTIQAKSGEEFLILADGDLIRLDYLISVDGKLLPKNC